MKKLLLVLGCLFLCACNKEDKMTIVLEGNPTTGYEWSYTIENEEIVNISSTKYEESKENEDLVGVGGSYTYIFSSVSQGETSITFVYERSFENEEPIYKVTYNVKVDENNKISLISKEGTYLNDDIPEPVIK